LKTRGLLNGLGKKKIRNKEKIIEEEKGGMKY
jgi:hypothetical protein